MDQGQSWNQLPKESCISMLFIFKNTFEIIFKKKCLLLSLDLNCLSKAGALKTQSLTASAVSRWWTQEAGPNRKSYVRTLPLSLLSLLGCGCEVSTLLLLPVLPYFQCQLNPLFWLLSVCTTESNILLEIDIHWACGHC